MPSVVLMLNAERGAGGGVSTKTVNNCSTLRRHLERANRVGLVLTDVLLSDGNWSTVIREVVERRSSAEVVVCDEKPTRSFRRETLLRGARCVRYGKVPGTKRPKRPAPNV